MTNCLFTYRLRAQLTNGTEVMNDNFINPLCVISMYWETRDDTVKRLNIFLVNGKSMNVSEAVGRKFIDHMEDYLRFLAGMGTSVGFPPLQRQRNNQQSGERHPRKALDVEIIDDVEPQQTNADWVG